MNVIGRNDEMCDGEMEGQQSQGVCTLENSMTGDSAVRNRQIGGGHSGVLSLAATKGHVWVYGPAAVGVCIHVCSPSYHQRPSRCLDWAATETIWIFEEHSSKGGHADLSGLCCHLRP